MILPFDQMPSSARLWIYQVDRQLTEAEETFVNKATEAFINQWAAHGQDLKASYQVAHNQFLIISVDESFNLASGCSIDASVNLVRGLEAELKAKLLDRTKVAVYQNEKVQLYPMKELKGLVADGKIKENTLIFNNLVHNVEDWKSAWLVPASESWLKKYFH